MLKRTCVQCGKEFEMNQSEINFYKKKKLSLPKRCKECREENKSKKKKNYQAQEADEKAAQKIEYSNSNSKDKKAGKQSGNQSGNAKPASGNSGSNRKEKKMSAGKQRLLYIVTAAVIALGGGGTAISTLNDAPAEDVAIEQTVELEDTTAAMEFEMEEVAIEYEFRNDELFENHYKKHGIEMGFDSAEEYLVGANRVIASPDVLHKTEAEDGDDVYYLEETNEFVVVSKAGYIRTYFKPSDGIDYYNRQ